MKLSQKLVDFNTEVGIAVPYLNTNKIRLAVTTGQVTDTGNFLTDWNTKYGIYITPSTHTSESVKDINDLYNLFHPYYIGVVQQIKNNKSITLTGGDIAALHIHVDAPHRHHVERPAFAPSNTMIKSTHLVNKIFTSNPNPPHEDDIALPADVSRIGRKLAVVPPAEIPRPEQYHNLETVGSTTFDLVFDPAQEAAKCYLITWYENNRGEAGPPSNPVSFVIS
ncbi:MAG: hypothetical protein ABI855_12345 [Bacteroidota bacterium]